MKKLFVSISEWWLDLEGSTRFGLIALTIGIIFGIFCLATDNFPKTNEENYVAMEKLIYNISEQKNVNQPFDTQYINSYVVTFNDNGNISIKVSAKGREELNATLKSDYQLKSEPERIGQSIIRRCFLFFGGCFLIGCVGTAIIYLIYFFIKFIIWLIQLVIKKIKSKNNKKE